MAAASQPRYLKQYSGQIDNGIEPACVSSRGRTTLGGVHAGMYRVLTETHPGTSVTQSAYAGYAILTNPGAGQQPRAARARDGASNALYKQANAAMANGTSVLQ